MAINYLKNYKQASVQTASPGKLILMLFDGALRFLEASKIGFREPAENFRRNEIIYNNITKSVNIFLELQSSINLEKGGDLAKTLYSLYDYMIRQLHKANLEKDIELVIEVERLLLPLREAWSQMLLQAS